VNENFVISSRLATMRVPLRIALLPMLCIVAFIAGTAESAAVMSIDLGTEWMKVSFHRNFQKFPWVSTFVFFRSASFHLECQWKSR
jgi:hypothetical protein